jgi:hypothetical protein
MGGFAGAMFFKGSGLSKVRLIKGQALRGLVFQDSGVRCFSSLIFYVLVFQGSVFTGFWVYSGQVCQGSGFSGVSIFRGQVFSGVTFFMGQVQSGLQESGS